MAGDHDAWERYAPWQGSYRASWRPSAVGGSPGRARARRLGYVLVAAVAVAVAVSVAVRIVVAVVRWDLQGLLAVLVSTVAVGLLPGLVLVCWPPQTTLAPSALSVRSVLWRTRSVAWEDVVDAQLPGRFDDHPVALLASGERLPLVALPLAVADEMAAVTRPVPSPPSRVSDRLPDQQDLDGPFRRGWSP